MNKEELSEILIPVQQPITEESLSKLKIKKYHSSRPIVLGDCVNYGLFDYDFKEDHTEISFKFAAYHIDEIDTIYRVKGIKNKYLAILELIVD